MKTIRLSIGMLIFGLLFLLLSAFIPAIACNGLKINIEDLLLNISATFISLALLSVAYKLFGEEQTISILKKVIRALEISQKILEIGIINIEKSRGDFDHNEIEKRLNGSKDIFVLSKNFSAIKYDRLRVFLTNFLNKGSSLKIAIANDSPSKESIQQFREGLPAKVKARIAIKEVDPSYIKCGMYGGDFDIYTTFYTNHLAGDESFTIHCQKVENKRTLYDVYQREFTYIWELGATL
jgi:hypothetical protein